MARQILIWLGIVEIGRFLGTRRGFFVSLVLAALGYILTVFPPDTIVRALIGYTDYLRSGLESTNAAYFADAFYYRLTGCNLFWSADDGWWRTACPGSGIDTDARFFLLIYRVGVAFVGACQDMWNASNLFRRTLFVLTALPVGGWLWVKMQPHDLSDGPFTAAASFALWCLVTPIAVSIVALLLLLILWVFAVVFSEVLGGIAFTGGLIYHGYGRAKAALEFHGLSTVGTNSPSAENPTNPAG